MEEIVLRNRHFGLRFFFRGSRNKISTREKTALQIENDLFGVQRFPRKICGAKLRAAAALDAGIHIQNIFCVKILEVNDSQVFAFFAKRANRAGRLRTQKYCDGR